MAYAAAIAAVAGAAISAYGAVKQGQYQKATSEYNAQIAQRDAEAARQKAEYDAEQSSREFKMLLGKQKALYAKAGVDLTEGSPLLMMAWQAEEGKRERELILQGGRTAEQSDLAKANIFRFQGGQAQTAGTISGGSTFLTGLANAGTSWSDYKSKKYPTTMTVDRD